MSKAERRFLAAILAVLAIGIAWSMFHIGASAGEEVPTPTTPPLLALAGKSAFQIRCSLADLNRSNPHTAASAAAVAATSAPATSSSAASAAAAAAAVAAAAASAPRMATAAVSALGGELYAGRMCSGDFLVEDIEGRQAHIKDFFLAEIDCAR
jgi:hypothetical protein